MIKLFNNAIGAIVTTLLSIVVVMRIESWAAGLKPTLGGEILYYAITMSAVWFGLALVGLSLGKLLPKRPEVANATDEERVTEITEIEIRDVAPEAVNYAQSTSAASANDNDPMTRLRLLNEELRLTDDPHKESEILAQMSALTTDYAEVFELSDDKDERLVV